MPGNPKRMLGTVTRIEQAALDVAISTIDGCPAAHLASKSGPRSPLAKLWIAAVDAATQTQLAVERLGDLLREKSGDRAPSAFKQRAAQMAEPENQADAARWATFKCVRERLTAGSILDASDALPSFDAMSAKGDAPFLAAVKWTSERLGFPDAEINWDDAPSATACGLLRWAKLDQNEFWAKFGVQLLPPRTSQTTAEEERANAAACLSNDELCDRIIAITPPAGGANGEPDLVESA